MDPFAQPPDPTTAPTTGPTPGPTPVPEVALTTEPPPQPRSKKGRVLASVAAVVVLGAGGFVVAKNIQSNSGGFDSPDAAVKALLKAADQEDVLGVVDVMRPGERSMLRDTLLPIEQEMERLDVLSKNVDMHKLPGLQMTVEGVTTTTSALDGRLAVVTLTGGTMTTNTSFADLPLGTILRDQIKPPTDSAGPTTTKLSGAKLATVKEDGRWYVSLGYTIAESARTSASKPLPDFAHPIAAPGAASPEAAVTGFSSAVADLDLNAAIGMLAPGEFGALQDYGTLFVPDAQKAIDQWKADNKVSVSITQASPKVERHGSSATVAFDTRTITAQWGSNSVKITVDAKNCATVTSDIDGSSNNQHVCVGDATGDTAEVPADVKPIVDRLKNLSLRAVAVQENGRWYVAPIRTVFDLAGQIVSVFKSADDFKAVQQWLGSLFTDAMNGGVLGGSVDSTGTATGDTTDTTTGDTTTGDTTTGDTTTGDLALPQALADFDTAFRAHMQAGNSAEQTLQAMSADGSIPDGLTFLDSAGTPVTDGSFTDVIGVEIDDNGTPACMLFGPDSTTPGVAVDCP